MADPLDLVQDVPNHEVDHAIALGVVARPWLAEAGVIDCFSVCGASTGALGAWVDEGHDTMAESARMDIDEIHKTGVKIHETPQAQNGHRQKAAALGKIKGLVFWCKKRKSMGLPLDSREFDHDELDAALEELEDEDESGDEDARVSKPEPFKPIHWVQWSEQFELHLSQISASIPGATLDYIVRDSDGRPGRTALGNMPADQQLCWTLSHRTKKCRTKDGPAVCKLLKELMLGTDGDAWLGGFTDDGVRSWEAPRQHCDGQNMRDAGISAAEAAIERIHYRNENNVINFEKFSTVSKENCRILKDNGREKQDEEMVDALLKKITDHAPQCMQQAKTNIWCDLACRGNFMQAVSRLNELVSKNDPRVPGEATGNRRSRASGARRGGQTNAQGSGGGRSNGGGNSRRRRRGRAGSASSAPSNGASNGGGGGNGNANHGVDISDPTRTFSRTEMQKLYQAGAWAGVKRRREEIHAARKRQRAGNASTGTGVPAPGDADIQARISALKGQARAQQDNGVQMIELEAPVTAGTRGDTNGLGFGAGAHRPRGGSQAPDIGSVTSSIRRFRLVSAIQSVHRIVSSAHLGHHPHTPDQAGTDASGSLESDSHADTVIAGANMLCLEFTGTECTVIGFKDDMMHSGVPVVTAVTACDDPISGETHLLIFHQALWFGDKMTHSLISSFQVRSNGITLNENPFDQSTPLGITDPDTGLHVPLEMRGPFAGIRTRVPDLEEVASCPNRIVMTSDAPWNPHGQSDLWSSRARIGAQAASIHNHHMIGRQMHQVAGEHEALISTCSSVFTPAGILAIVPGPETRLGPRQCSPQSWLLLLEHYSGASPEEAPG